VFCYPGSAPWPELFPQLPPAGSPDLWKLLPLGIANMVASFGLQLRPPASCSGFGLQIWPPAFSSSFGLQLWPPALASSFFRQLWLQALVSRYFFHPLEIGPQWSHMERMPVVTHGKHTGGRTWNPNQWSHMKSI